MCTRAPIVEAVATKQVDVSSFTVFVAMFVKHEVEKNSPDKGNT